MIVDTERLKEKVTNCFAEKALNIDRNVKNEARAIKALTQLEVNELHLLEIINKIEMIAHEYEGITNQPTIPAKVINLKGII